MSYLTSYSEIPVWLYVRNEALLVIPVFASSAFSGDKESAYGEVEEEEEEGGMDQELTAKEKRTLERKLKKERKKEQKKLMREAGIVSKKKEEIKKPSGSELALEYLTRSVPFAQQSSRAMNGPGL
ncbi:UNVERIFIED_CONTAM: hypothetical protein K2H54_020651 [Gekko kuhli]